MLIFDFPGCCTAKVITGFGQENTAEYGRFSTATQQDIERDLKEAINRYKNDSAVLCATTTQNQKRANKALKKLGFKSTRWLSKGGHSENKLKLWFLKLDEVN